MKRFCFILGFIMTALILMGQQQPAPPFEKLDFLIGEWSGTGRGFGNDTSVIHSSFKQVMDGKYIEVVNDSQFKPTEKKPQGEHHIDRGFISVDSTRKEVVFRQFNSEGFINQYVLNEALSTDTVLIFETEAIENLPKGKARWTLKKISDTEIETVFEVSFDGVKYSCFGTNTLHKELSQPVEKKQMTQEEMMEKWMKVATPGEKHDYFKNLIGNWDIVSTLWEPGQEPQVSKGTVEAKMIMDGRYLMSHMDGEYSGMPYMGLMISGYDNLNKCFNTFWIDNFGTGMYMTTGQLDDSNKVMMDTGEWDDFMTGGKMHVRMVTTIMNDNEMKYEMYYSQQGSKETKSMEIRYKRKDKK